MLVVQILLDLNVVLYAAGACIAQEVALVLVPVRIGRVVGPGPGVRRELSPLQV